MAKKKGDSKDNDDYDEQLYELHVELVRLQRHVIESGERVLIVVEGRDGAGKDGTIKRIIEHLSPRETRVVALAKPSDREQSQWYFQRFIAHLPAASEVVIFNRSWYNRAGVEPVMGFCSPGEVEDFFRSVIAFEAMLVRSGIRLLKYYLDIDKEEQKKRLAERRRDPLKQWKLSPIDAVAIKKWPAYSQARDAMFRRSHHALAPWRIVQADDKKTARLNVIRDILSAVRFPGRAARLARPDRKIVFPYYDGAIEDGRLAP
ncbi:MAG: polyphosphate kinase 2 [Alphaproteobacteria bacterium]|nr:polyphosphate kinase 2 [Alphaproteobacteria bacterium]